MRKSNEEKERDLLARRREVLALPMVALRRHGWLSPSDEDPSWRREPRAVGIGPDGEAIALWDHVATDGARLVTRHRPGRDTDGVTFSGARPASFIQPLPDGQVLLVDARSRTGGSRGGETAEVRDDRGTWMRSGHLGDAVEHVLTTPTGDIWAGYFDEAAAHGRGLGGHGLVRFGTDLEPRWLYPFGTALPRIDDCLALNVVHETALALVYNALHLVRVEGEHATDHGRVPHVGADAVLVDGDRALIVGGYGSELDLVTPVRIAPDGVYVAGPPARLVMPDGQEIRSARLTGRGSELHVVTRSGAWLRASLEDFPRDD